MKRLKDNISSQYFEAANRMKPKTARKRIVAYVEAYDDVFADIVNGLLFDGEEIVRADALSDQSARAAYKVDGKLREHERDVLKHVNACSVRIASVGFEMYCKLLEEAVENLKHGKKDAVLEPPPDPIIDLSCEAYLDADYIDDAMHKIEIYQRIAAIRSDEEVKALYEEMRDRFGELSAPARNLLEAARIKNHARALGLRSVIVQPKALALHLMPGRRLPAKGLMLIDKYFGHNLRRIIKTGDYEIGLTEAKKKHIASFVLRVLLLADGDEEAAMASQAEKMKSAKEKKINGKDNSPGPGAGQGRAHYPGKLAAAEF